ncbi:S8 family peptidase [Zhongshania sp.]|jgi:hypothetical protein|uniref:S8 family peptidase n=1 Tax=Zhongshania sp. TaxID=1971902 RepID=UPI002A83219E|nr:S8 family peptidase [Zhongshania sp.]
MDYRPHLTFLAPKTALDIDRLPGNGGSLTSPSPATQFTRFQPIIGNMQRQFAEHIALCESVEGLSPEKILVLEVAGSVKNFAIALQKVKGFEYLSRWLTDEIVEENSVYTGSSEKPKPVEREIYLTMSNQDGLNRLFAEWRKISETGAVDYGMTPLRDALRQLHRIRFWNTEDRIKKTGLLEDWRYRILDVERYGTENVPFEIELWFKKSGVARSKAENELTTLLASLGGSVSGSFVHTGIAYHALRGELPIQQVQKVIELGAEQLQLMRSDDVMFFRPLGQCGFSLRDESIISTEEDITINNDQNVDSTSAIVALFDGLPLENHEAIKNRITVDDPDHFSDFYSAPKQQLHGTAMASLIIHGDRGAGDRPLETPLYVRPILAPGSPSFDGKRMECIPEGTLPLDLIHRAVKRLFEGDGGVVPMAPNVKAINLSVCDPRQLFDRNMSPWARMLDWLSYRYNVLFVVSAGNHLDDINLDLSLKEFTLMSLLEREKAMIGAINRTRWSRRLMSPAEAINAITVKATHHDCSESHEVPGIFDPFVSEGMFSPINPISFGKANGVKPEVMASGGRVTYKSMTYSDDDPVALRVVNTPKAFGPGHKIAVPSDISGAINRYAFSYGTSNAAALVTRRIALLHETIESMKLFQHDDALQNAPESVILKALIVHGAEISEKAAKASKAVLHTKENSRTYKSEQGQYFGYGQINEKRIHACSSNQATLIRSGVLKLGESDTYSFPLPPCLASIEQSRRMIITLAWFSPINPVHNEYNQAQMWVSDPKKSSALNFSQGDYYHHSQKKGTVYHDVIYGDKASPYLSGQDIRLKVNCKARAAGQNIKIPYALVVTLDTPNIELPVYEEVKLALEQQVTQSVSNDVALKSNTDIVNESPQ